MSRRFLPLNIFGLMCLVGLAVGADDPKSGDTEPPVRLKKRKKPAQPDTPPEDKAKEQPKIDEPAPKDKDKEATEPGPGPEPGPGAQESEKEILSRIGQNMKAHEDRIINKELDETTRQIEDDIIKDIDTLIHRAEQPPPSGGGGGGGQSKASGGGTRQETRMQSRPGGQRGSSGGQNQGGDNAGSKGSSGTKPGGKNGNGGNGMGGGNQDNNPPKPPTDDDEKGKWGHLPESMRAQMKAYANREEYMSKYQDLIKEYYRNLAKQGRNPKD